MRQVDMTFSRLGSLGVTEAQWYSIEALRKLADAAQVALLYELADQGGKRYAKLADLYTERFLRGEPYPHWALNDNTIWFPLELT
jgi:hypothetical protein